MATLIIFGAYFIFGISGFGSSIISVPLLVQMYPLKSVVPMMVIIDICGSLYVGRKSSQDANLKELKWLFPFTLLGMILGIVLLIKAPSEPLLIILGCFAALNGARVLWQRNSEMREPINKWWAAPFGFFGGTFTALFATGGPIYVSYLGLRINDPRALRATMAFAILMLTLLRLTLMLVTGLILSWPVIGLAVCLMPATFFGIWLGTHVHAKLSNAAMRVAYGSILFFAGTMLLIRQL
ncbi:sulfite exporter TauE/SafE family protein [Polynucleobacter sp. AP-Feld-500C-C5]|uniref:sulfite exporter TauE/SafE family protein n=1 Tax=Polynucleobacter sp. AP-Feld-500C-C5 TaxID=2576924 RepID=UPI001C0BD800|nr:sulfite exporter TauE/SafE family protein [Polynucleobacter sp. AP-Feld-500C-C5]MBU3633540.1 sulfite exporter TauE/SafE family protein [Polynucleobacter sp. AP-Feld-500C-C5]